MVYTVFGAVFGDFLMFVTVCIGMGVNCYVIDHYQLRVGVFAAENVNLVDQYFTKPWTKVFATAIGVYSANLYMDILDYRKVYNEEFKRESYPWIHYLH